MDLPDISYENKNIFSIPFFEWVNPHHSSIVDELLNVFYEYSKQNPQSDVTPHLKNNLYESPFSFMEDLENEKVIQFFRTYILESVGRITQDINREYWDTFKAKFGADKLFWKPYIQESWFHITKKGGYHGYHNHPNCDWGFIYYFTSHKSEEQATNRFYDVRTPGLSRYTLGNLWHINTSNYQVEPLEGKCVLFPAWLYHDSDVYIGDTDRIVFSANISIYSPHSFDYVPTEIVNEWHKLRNN